VKAERATRAGEGGIWPRCSVLAETLDRSLAGEPRTARELLGTAVAYIETMCARGVVAGSAFVARRVLLAGCIPSQRSTEFVRDLVLAPDGRLMVERCSLAFDRRTAWGLAASACSLDPVAIDEGALSTDATPRPMALPSREDDPVLQGLGRPQPAGRGRVIGVHLR